MKRGKRDIVAGDVDSLREMVVDAGLLMRVTCCGARRMVVRIDCMNVLIVCCSDGVLWVHSRGAYILERCGSRMIVYFLDCPRCVVRSKGSKHEEVRRIFGRALDDAMLDVIQWLHVS